MIASLLWLGLLVGCSSTPDKPDSPTTEQSAGDQSEFSAQPQRAAVELPDATSIGDDTDASATGAVAPHVNARIRAAIDSADQGRSDVAIQTLAELVNEPEGGFLAAFNLGVIYDRKGDLDVAARRYIQALQKNPDFSPALTNLVRIYLRQNRLADADDIARRFVDLRSENLEHRAVRLEVFLAQKRFEDVVRSAKEILRKDERHVDAMLAMAHANYQLERYELGLAILRSAIKLAPRRAEIYYLYGNLELAMGRSPSAMANYRRAIELQSDYPEARNNLGLLYHEARDHEAAVEQFLFALDGFPDFKQAYLNLGNAYKGMARFKEAEGAFLRALALDNDYADAYFNLGILYLESDLPGMEAIPRLHRSIEVFNQYRRAARGQMTNEDPVARFIEEANKSIEQARQREDMARRAQTQAETPPIQEDGVDDDDE
ncbi:MAG: tetratricopeptide repeat protein [Bradymonadaceae bacterium]|nr:tetratricopeptide repeat protein [Lujinxingiaceae bacterium]